MTTLSAKSTFMRGLPKLAFALLVLLPNAQAVRDSLVNRIAPTIHVFYAADESSINGLCGSIHSLLVTCSQPQRLVVDVVVKKVSFPIFQERFGMQGKSLSAVSTLGAVIQLHPLEDANISELFQHQTSSTKSIEKYVRFFIDTWLPHEIVVYLDTDVVVQSDVLVLGDQLAASGKTMAFVERVPHVAVGENFHADNASDADLAKLAVSRSTLIAAERATEYNAGVLVLSTSRWTSLRYMDNVKRWLHINVALRGKLLRGFEQTLLMLSMEVWREPATRDFIVVESEWNVEVHHQLTIDQHFLAHQAKILHFNGDNKPWLPSEAEDPLSIELFQPHLKNCHLLFQKEEGLGREQPRVPLMAAVALLVALALLVLWNILPTWNRIMSPSESALHVNLMICFQGFMNYSSVVLCAYPLCLALNLTNAASMSGLVIGVFMEASAVGMGVGWKILNVYPDTLRWRLKTCLVAGLFCQLLGALALCQVALAVRSGQIYDGLVVTLLTARIIQGFGHGLNDQFMKCCIVKLAPASARSRHSLKKFVANTLGIGCGPIITAVAFFLSHDDMDIASSQGAQITIVTGQWQVIMTLSALLGTVILYPSLEDMPEYCKVNNAAAGQQITVLVASIFMDALRGFMVSGVEAASCLLLQDHFSWRHDSVGLVIGLTFCLVVPGYMLHKRYAEWFGDVAWIRIYTCLAMLATVMLGTATQPTGIIAADCVIFPSVYLAGALNMGLLNNNVFPDGSMFDANNVMLINGIISNGIGRFAGPVFSRSLIAQLGQKAYASCQAFAMGSVLAASSMLEAPVTL
ncbi:unnamed protein product [Effrenium voratum]|uniref:Uncharacterized protein n=1 Tax=Effrenium voratum TaxID=2562239 RepID=A0AA36JCV3_9DINO|nr:unnamed protein product [Effrenium voratum]CAJ1456499.1 unnamed protein product [Effrenium voratum]